MNQPRQHSHRHRKEIHRKLKESFTSIRARGEEVSRTEVNVHVGPANSGKTYDSIEKLKSSGSGIYLAPLRLLAWEVADKLNAQGYPCSLVTGEERVIVPGARYVSSTVEMFNLDFQGDCIVLDEAQMLADEQRGWAWMRVVANALTSHFEIIASPDAEQLISNLLKKVGYPFKVIHHKRLAPLTVSAKPWRIDQPDPGTIFVVFSRAGVLSLKSYFEKRGYSVSAIYGNLPPEVKKKQAERFLKGEAQLCVATDAIGMGINLPAQRVCFTTMTKFDGEKQRELSPAEVRQIAGRAGRFGLKEGGEVGALTYDHIEVLGKQLAVEPPDLAYARISPELSDIEMMQGPLAHRLAEWERHRAIPEHLKDVIMPADLEHQKSLAALLKEEVVEKLGLSLAYSLIKAPANDETAGYWLACVRGILDQKPLPLPFHPGGDSIKGQETLLTTETRVAQCDIYLWLANREGTANFAPEKEKVMEAKWKMIDQIDHALTQKLDLRQKCRQCGKTLPLLHSFGVCENCHRQSQRRYFAKPKFRKFRFK